MAMDMNSLRGLGVMGFISFGKKKKKNVDSYDFG